MRETTEHSRFREKVENGTILVGIDLATARKFFTDNTPALRASIGESLHIERLLVSTAFFLTYILLLATLAVAFLKFGWWGMLLGPISTLVCGYFISSASVQEKSIVVVLIPLVVAISFALQRGSPLAQWVSFGLASVMFARITYRTAGFFFRALIVRNPRAYEILQNSVVLAEQ